MIPTEITRLYCVQFTLYQKWLPFSGSHSHHVKGESATALAVEATLVLIILTALVLTVIRIVVIQDA